MAKFLNPEQSPLLSSEYLEALNFAFDAHYRQVRKGQIECPYIAHVLAVSGLVLEAGGNEDEAIASYSFIIQNAAAASMSAFVGSLFLCSMTAFLK